MSVRMAMAKLCACTCGGAIIGGGAVHVRENPPERPAVVHSTKGQQVRTAATGQRRVVRRTVRRTACAAPATVTTRTYTQAAPAPIPYGPPPMPPQMGGGYAMGGSGGGP